VVPCVPVGGQFFPAGESKMTVSAAAVADLQIREIRPPGCSGEVHITSTWEIAVKNLMYNRCNGGSQ
jgi:hypothetical protein